MSYISSWKLGLLSGNMLKNSCKSKYLDDILKLFILYSSINNKGSIIFSTNTYSYADVLCLKLMSSFFSTNSSFYY